MLDERMSVRRARPQRVDRAVQKIVTPFVRQPRSGRRSLGAVAVRRFVQRARVACATIRVVVLDWRELSGLSSGELQAALLAELDVVMAGHSYQEEDELLARLPVPLRVMWVLSWLDFEVTQGSLLAYFSNTPGRHAAQAVQALRDIGAAGMADVVMRAAESVTAASEEWAARRDEMNRQPEHSVVRPYVALSNADQLVELTDQYWAAADEEGWWGDKLDAFLSRPVEAEARR